MNTRPNFGGHPVAAAVWDPQQNAWTENGQVLAVDGSNNVTAIGATPLTGGNTSVLGSVNPPGNWNGLRDNPIGNFVFGKAAPQQPGAGGPAKDPSKLIQDPNTGMFFDPTSGTSYVDATGQTVITNPNVAQQVALNVQKSNAFLAHLNGLEQERQGVNAGQNGLADSFRSVISGNAPSVAAMQATAGGQEAARQQLAQVAGASGASAPLASLMAARNTGQAMTGANNAGAIARVGEQKSAMDALNALLNSQQTGIANTASRDVSAGIDFANLANSGQTSQQGLNATAAQKKAEDEAKFGAGAVKTVASALAPGQ